MKKQIIKNDFLFKNTKKSVRLKFLNKVSKSLVYVSKATGLAYHPNFIQSEKIAGTWEKIYKKKKNSEKISYTSDFPGMQSRHYYIIDFLRREINLKKKLICDFACGEGSILIKLKKYFNYYNLAGTEINKENIKFIKKLFKNENFKAPKLFLTSIENFPNVKKDLLNIDVGILAWTLCCCARPTEVVESLSKSIKKNGYLIVAESSRILVPFKKPIQSYFTKNKLGSHHPWHFSFNSLSNIFKIYGFELVSHNRYWDEDNLILLFKNTGVKNQKLKFDNYIKVSNFFSRWLKESLKYSNSKY